MRLDIRDLHTSLATLLLPLTLPHADQCSQIFQRQTLQQIFDKVIKYPTTSEMHCYTTLRSVYGQKQPCSRIEPFETIAEKYSSSDINTILLIERKDSYSGHMEKTALNDRLYAHALTKSLAKTSAHTIDVQFSHSLMARHIWLTVHKFHTCRS